MHSKLVFRDEKLLGSKVLIGRLRINIHFGPKKRQEGWYGQSLKSAVCWWGTDNPTKVLFVGDF